eukprot:CAMPEP_0185835634 /NCGR_PEP_ID=MMETSP1353-20130828/8172_1 /TAXON_ID=1077150 /ORGANISM="Erythrolobus australicus, Strain CCMP3124" /LENGTH=103 /DNA_ID=CAMNT_0028534297 /DNA_START=186 /DNA_END=494 /DNA_ORIENTATION=-
MAKGRAGESAYTQNTALQTVILLVSKKTSCAGHRRSTGVCGAALPSGSRKDEEILSYTSDRYGLMSTTFGWCFATRAKSPIHEESQSELNSIRLHSSAARGIQ